MPPCLWRYGTGEPNAESSFLVLLRVSTPQQDVEDMMMIPRLQHQPYDSFVMRHVIDEMIDIDYYLFRAGH